MSIDIQRETLKILSVAARVLPRRRQGRPVHQSTLWRWHRRGVWNGVERIYLECVRTPSGMATSVEALQRFLDKLSGCGHTGGAETEPPNDIDSAIEALDTDGI